jgi:hypothetical protein
LTRAIRQRSPQNITERVDQRAQHSDGLARLVIAESRES